MQLLNGLVSVHSFARISGFVAHNSINGNLVCTDSIQVLPRRLIWNYIFL